MAQGNETGTVKFFKKEQGFGFIIDEKQNEIFFHVKNCKENAKLLRSDDKVTFEIGSGKKGDEAINVSLSK